MSQRRLSIADKLLSQADRALRTLAPGNMQQHRPSPADSLDEVPLNEAERRHAAGLMRVNHAGEVCAQALYQGQALTAKLPGIRREMEAAANEEVDHLAWCQQRLQSLGSRPSVLNPLWYGMSFGIGAVAGLVGDRVSLGFVAATEQQVCEHLQNHLQTLPPEDARSRAVVQEMLADEARHASTALQSGGARFPGIIKAAMTLASRAMTKSSYRL